METKFNNSFSARISYFSIIELLIVISILTALTVMIFPSLDKTLTAARGNTCFSNYRSISLAFESYIGDYTKYPPFRWPKESQSNKRRQHRIFWDDFLGGGYDGRNLNQYLMEKGMLRKSLREDVGTDIYSCPLDNHGNMRDFDSGRDGFTNLQKDGIYRSYSLNSYRSSNGVPDSQKQAFAGVKYRSRNGDGVLIWTQSQNRVINPSSVFLLVERPGVGFVGAGGGASSGNPLAQEGFYDIRFWKNKFGITVPEFENIRYHYEGWNYLFADGHVQNFIPEDTFGEGGDLTNPKGSYWSISVTD